MAAKVKLMGAAEIQARLRISRQRTSVLIHRRDFPPPIASLAMGHVWDAEDVEAWIREHRPRLDEPDAEG